MTLTVSTAQRHLRTAGSQNRVPSDNSVSGGLACYKLLYHAFIVHANMAQRYQHLEHAILTLVLKYGDQQGYGNTLGGLANTLRETFPDVATREIIDTLKRLEPRYVTLWKYSQLHARLLPYSKEEIEDEYLFGLGEFCIRRTPETDPRAQELALELGLPEAGMTSTISEEGRKHRFARWEGMGLDRVKADLVHNRGSGQVGGSHEVVNLAWEWVRMKEAENSAVAKQDAPAATLALIAEERIEQLRRLKCSQFDLKKLVRLCEEINAVYGAGCYFATAMLIRGVLDHVPPLFGFKTFNEVVNNYASGGKAFRDHMEHLHKGSRKVADAYLHMPVRQSETLPTPQQVNSGQNLDALLAEIVRVWQ